MTKTSYMRIPKETDARNGGFSDDIRNAYALKFIVSLQKKRSELSSDRFLAGYLIVFLDPNFAKSGSL